MNQIYALINTQKTNKKGDDNIVLLFLLVLILVLVRWRTARLSFPLDEFLETSFIYSIKIWRVQGFPHFFSLWGTYNHTHLFPKGNGIILQRQFTQAFLSHLKYYTPFEISSPASFSCVFIDTASSFGSIWPPTLSF